MLDDRRAELVDRFRHGHCYPMAAALGDRLGLPIRALVVDTGGDLRPHVVHAWAATAEGRGLDAGGEVTDDGIVDEYLSSSCREFRKPRFVNFADRSEFLDTLRVFFGNDADWGWYEKVFAEQLKHAREALDDGLLHSVELETASPSP